MRYLIPRSLLQFLVPLSRWVGTENPYKQWWCQILLIKKIDIKHWSVLEFVFNPCVDGLTPTLLNIVTTFFSYALTEVSKELCLNRVEARLVSSSNPSLSRGVHLWIWDETLDTTGFASRSTSLSPYAWVQSTSNSTSHMHPYWYGFSHSYHGTWHHKCRSCTLSKKIAKKPV